MKKFKTTRFSNVNQKLKEKVYSLKFITGISKQLLYAWKNESLIPLHESNENGWNKYSLVDILWIGIIEELKKFGFTSEKILKIKKQLLTVDEIIENDDDEGEKIETINLAVIEIFMNANAIYIIVDEDGKTDVLNAYAIIEKMQHNELTNHVILNLNQLIKLNIEVLYEEPTLDYFKGLSKDEIKVLLILRSNNFKTIEIIKKGGGKLMIEKTEIVSNHSRIYQILKDHEYQKINMIQAKGKIVQFSRTVQDRLED